MKRFRPKHYHKSIPWQVISETFIEQTETRQPNFLDWIRGSYYVEVPVSDDLSDGDEGEGSEVTVRLTISLDFMKHSIAKEFIDWTIDARTSKIRKIAAYPGIHRGAIFVHSQAEAYRMIWRTPIFSPYVKVETNTYLDDETKARFGHLEMGSRPDNRKGLVGASLNEVVHLGSGRMTVCVLQEVLKDTARLLIYGPRYSDMRLPAGVEYEKVSWPVRNEVSLKFFESENFPEAAAFFSRAYCQAGVSEGGGLAVIERRCQKTVQIIEAMFEHYKIVREPHWIKSSREDWVDDLREDAMALKTVDEWRRFETKWATITSYACGLNLHEGPWAGEDWMLFVAPRG
jgi:hypothetical protein